MCFIHSSFNIAIKSSRCAPNAGGDLRGNLKNNDLGALMDEAKCMLEVGNYHDNIVNLQGVTLKIENETIVQVMFISGSHIVLFTDNN